MSLDLSRSFITRSRVILDFAFCTKIDRLTTSYVIFKSLSLFDFSILGNLLRSCFQI